MLLDDHSRIFAKARPTSLYNTVYSTSLYLHVTSIEIISILFPGVKIPSSNPFVEARDYECHRFFIVSKRRPLKFSLLESFPCSLRTKKTRSLASPISIWRGMQTLPRHLESLSPSRDASPSPPTPITRPIPLLSNVTKIIPLLRSFPVDVSRNYPLETRYKTGSVAKLRLYYSGPVPELVLLIVTPFLRPSSGR